ncbi:conserved hypothetical protein [Cryptococcus deneoformans JEC21]|uniref:Bromo domain-containing protein n=1 Tax=Cryptococcus deneoformans (strain JEC21 / ATCC MYA-565) TaxID=214684 RepID=Q5KB82_CRYD1|nr:conserved hypothetical protein [Cryptococcus neoformans var. neoformans JEC21]AAW45314.2 conserved hypothetical protein [Cryptococcus neoformans var. neoformans JEC21]
MSSQTPLSDPLTTQEKLLLSQAVYKLGAFSWAEVSSLLLDHPCIKDATPHARPAKLFTPERCEGIYKELMGAIGINVPAPDGIKPHAKSHLRLAQNYYIARLTELQNEISSYETRFTSLMSEITALKKGELDEQLREEIKAGLERKYGKKAVEEWMPGKAEIQKAVEDGPVKEGEVDPELAKKEKEEKQKDVEEPRKGVEIVGASTLEENPAVSVLGKQEGPSKSLKPEFLESKVKNPIEQMKTPDASRATLSPQPSPLSPAPSDHSPSRSVKTAADEEKEEEDAEKEEEKGEGEQDEEVVPEKKTNKRKAVSQPKGAPPTKRNSRRGAVTEEPEEFEAGEAAEEEEEEGGGAEEKEEEPPTTRGRRSKRSSLTKPSASPSLPPKDTSPAISRRAPSVSSTTSAATPGGEGERRSSRRAAAPAAGRRGMRDDVVSKSVRGQTADAADADDGPPTPTAAEEHEPEIRKSTRASRRKSGLPEQQQQAAATPTPVERERRGTRATTRNLRESVENEHASANNDDHDDHDDDDTTNNNDDDMENPDPDSPTAPTPNNSIKEKGKKSSKPFLFSLLEAMASHRFGTIFESPVRKSDAPDYYSVIKRPMDLKTIKGKIKDGRIERIDELERDVLLMFSNAMMYNAPDSQVYEMAKEMMKDCEGHFAHFRNMEMELDNEG